MDALRDLMSYRFIELSMIFLEISFEKNADLMELIKQTQTLEELFLSEAEMENGLLRLSYLPKEGCFICRFEAASFKTQVLFQYDFETADIGMAVISSFEGEESTALSWAKELLERMEDILYAQEEEV